MSPDARFEDLAKLGPKIRHPMYRVLCTPCSVFCATLHIPCRKSLVALGFEAQYGWQYIQLTYSYERDDNNVAPGSWLGQAPNCSWGHRLGR